MTTVRTRERVQELLERGLSQNEVARELGLVKSTVAYHARRLGRAADERCNRRYDWTAVQRFYDNGHSVSDCQTHFGFSRASWFSAMKRGAVVARPQAMTIETLLTGRRNRSHVKLRLMHAGLLDRSVLRVG